MLTISLGLTVQHCLSVCCYISPIIIVCIKDLRSCLLFISSPPVLSPSLSLGFNPPSSDCHLPIYHATRLLLPLNLSPRTQTLPKFYGSVFIIYHHDTSFIISFISLSPCFPVLLCISHLFRHSSLLPSLSPLSTHFMFIFIVYPLCIFPPGC